MNKFLNFLFFCTLTFSCKSMERIPSLEQLCEPLVSDLLIENYIIQTNTGKNIDPKILGILSILQLQHLAEALLIPPDPPYLHNADFLSSDHQIAYKATNEFIDEAWQQEFTGITRQGNQVLNQIIRTSSSLDSFAISPDRSWGALLYVGNEQLSWLKFRSNSLSECFFDSQITTPRHIMRMFFFDADTLVFINDLDSRIIKRNGHDYLHLTLPYYQDVALFTDRIICYVLEKNLYRKTQDEKMQIAQSPEDLVKLSFCKTKRLLAGGSKQGTIFIWQMNENLQETSGMHILKNPLAARVENLCFDEEGSILIAGQSGGTLTIWDLEHHKLLLQFKLKSINPIRDISFAPKDGSLAIIQKATSFPSDAEISLYKLNHLVLAGLLKAHLATMQEQQSTQT